METVLRVTKSVYSPFTTHHSYSVTIPMEWATKNTSLNPVQDDGKPRDALSHISHNTRHKSSI